MPDLRDQVRDAYSAASENPRAPHAFPVGHAFAAGVGYPAEWLGRIPDESVDAFAGVSNVSVFADIREGNTVLDLGCGAGMDSFVAARRVGPEGRVLGVDFSRAMLARARHASENAGL